MNNFALSILMLLSLSFFTSVVNLFGCCAGDLAACPEFILVAALVAVVAAVKELVVGVVAIVGSVGQRSVRLK